MSTKISNSIQGQNLSLSQKVAYQLFRFFASLKLAIFTLSSLIVALAIGTFVESKWSADAARILVYDTVWLTLILILLVLNLACSAADRLPWKKKHTGFVLTHLGIIILLAGSLATQKAAVDGQMSLEEGDSGKWVTLKDPMLYFYSQTFKEERMIPLHERALRWKGRETVAHFQAESKKATIAVTQFYPNTRSKNVWKEDRSGVAALRVNLKNPFVDVTEWLADTPSSREVMLGPATLRLTDTFEKPVASAPQKEQLEILRNGESVEVTIPAALPFEQMLANGLQLKWIAIYRYAYVEENTLKEGAAPQHAENPAVVLEVSQNGKTEKHTVFAHFPDFPTVHGRPESELGLQLHYHVATADSMKKHELRFVPQKEGLYYQVISGQDQKQGLVNLGQEVDTGWMNLKFKVESFIPQAVADLEVTALDDDDPSESATAAIELEVTSGDEKQVFWLAEGLQKSFELAGGLTEIVFGRRQLALGFEVLLKDFRVKHDPGTERAAAYESDVVVKDFTRGKTFEKKISMNEPLEYRGFKIYQAGYQVSPEGKETSVFAVGRDPGIPLKYAGAIIMVIGILLMFYTRKFSTTNGRGLK